MIYVSFCVTAFNCLNLGCQNVLIETKITFRKEKHGWFVKLCLLFVVGTGIVVMYLDLVILYSAVSNTGCCEIYLYKKMYCLPQTEFLL